MQETLVTLINDFAIYKLQQNNPNRRRSRYLKWYPITRYELYKMFTVIIAMGIDRRQIYVIIGLWILLITHRGIMNFPKRPI